jgi:hypothetical protein
VYEAAAQEFGEAEWARLTLAVVAINGWNRFNVAFLTPPEITSRRSCTRPAEQVSVEWGDAAGNPRRLPADIPQHVHYMTIARHVRAFGVAAWTARSRGR